MNNRLVRNVLTFCFFFAHLILCAQDYLVIDLSGGPDAENYPVRYTNEPPDLSNDTCRTTELWLRRIPAGTFMMGSPEDELGRDDDEAQHQVSLTKDYYIGVFECTQKQWELVMGSNPSQYKGDTRPVDTVSYQNAIRGVSPSIKTVGGESFFGKLQLKTGLEFDLPTEAQWEYACRAGTTTALNSGKNLTSVSECPNMNEVGRYKSNRSDGTGGYTFAHTKVGMYPPNAWGLYDMHGNVGEYSREWYGLFNAGSVIDPEGPSSGTYIVERGGSWEGGAEAERSAFRERQDPVNGARNFGFRIACLDVENTLAEIVVTTAEDVVDADDGVVSFVEAVTQSNASGNALITFNIPDCNAIDLPEDVFLSGNMAVNGFNQATQSNITSLRGIIHLSNSATLSNFIQGNRWSSRDGGDIKAKGGSLEHIIVAKNGDFYATSGTKVCHTTVLNGGAFITEDTDIKDIWVEYGALFVYSAGDIISGTLSIGGAAEKYIKDGSSAVTFSDAAVIFDITNWNSEGRMSFFGYNTPEYLAGQSVRTHYYSVLIDDFSSFSGAASYTVRVKADQELGTYSLMGNAGDFSENASLAVGDKTYHDVLVPGGTFIADNRTYSLALNDANVLQLTIADYNGNANPPDWTTPSHLANSMTIDAVVTQTDGSGIDTDGSVLAFFDADGNCRGTATLRKTAFGTKVYSVQVWSDAATENGLTAKVWNASTGEVMDVNGTFDFAQDTAMGSAAEPVVLKVGLATVVWTLNSGWNWVAANVTPQNADIAELLAGYTASDGDQIKTKDGYSTYYANYKLWDPALSIVPGRMYAFQRKAGGSATVEISGAPLDADNTLPLVAGWNWIGCFTDAESIAVSSLASTGGFSNNDQLKGRGSAYTTYYKNSSFSAWDGTLTTMTAGNGYKLYVAKAGTLSATAAEQIRSGASCWTEKMRGSGDCPWTTPDSYANSMTLDAVVKLDSETYLEADGSAIGVFDGNGNCRGVASIRTTAWGAVIYSGQVWSNYATEKGFTLKLWNGSSKEIGELNETIDFTQDTAYGSAMAPVTFTAVPQKPEWEYSLDDNGNVSITAYNGKAKNLVIPAELDGHPVTAIASGAFGTNDTLTSVTLPIRVNLPAENIFAGCKNLTSVNYTLDGIRTDFGQNVNVNIDGATTKETSVTLNPGWNLIAIPHGELLPESKDALDGLDSALYYDNTSQCYLKTSDMEFDVPYWIFTKEKLVIKVRTK